MMQRRCSTWVSLFGLLVAIGCDSNEPVSSPARTEKADAPRPVFANEAGSANCPSGDTDLPFPYQPEVDACVRAATRKRECETEILRASEDSPPDHPAVAAGEPLPADAKLPSTKLHKWHLLAQCECFEARRSKVETCLEKSDCSGFARCFVELGRDGWAP